MVTETLLLVVLSATVGSIVVDVKEVSCDVELVDVELVLLDVEDVVVELVKLVDDDDVVVEHER